MSHNQRIFLLQAQWYLKMKCHYLNETKNNQDIEDQIMMMMMIMTYFRWRQ